MSTNPTITITKEEATSSQVDDFLKRQMSMRGDPGVTRDRSRKWYYQSWLVFMIVGAIGAFTAWAIIEPILDDMTYIQGPISEVNLEDTAPSTFTRKGRVLQLSDFVVGSITIKDQKITLLKRTKVLQPDGTKKRLDPQSLSVGQTIGV